MKNTVRQRDRSLDCDQIASLRFPALASAAPAASVQTARTKRRGVLLAAIAIMGLTVALSATNPAHANSTGGGTTNPGPSPKPEKERPEPGKASAATTADLCDRPTSIKPVGYAEDAKTWPCKNFSK